MKKLSIFMIIVAGIFWGSIGIFVKSMALFGFTSAQSAAIRLTIAALIFLIMNLIKSPKSLKIDLKDLWLFALLGIGSILSMTFVYFETIKHTSLSVAAILLYTAPIMVTVMSAIFYREKITLLKTTALIMAFLGIVLISSPGASSHITVTGIILGLLSAFTYASYSIISKFILKKYSPSVITAYAFAFAALGALLLCNFPDMILKYTNFSGNYMKLLLFSAGIGIVTAAIPFTLYTAALKWVEPGKASVLASVEPLAATIFGITLYHERLVPLAIVGIILIFISVTFLSVSKS